MPTMATEQQQYKLAGLVVEHQSSIREFSNEDAQWAIQNTAEAIKLWGEAIKNRVKAVVANLITLATNILVRQVDECKVKDLFRGKHIAYRDGDLNNWLRKSVPGVIELPASSYRLGKEMNFVEMSAKHLGIAKDLNLVATTLVERGKFFSPKQVDDMLVACDRGENPFHLRTDGWANLIPIFDGASVFFLSVYRSSDGWNVGVSRLEDSNRWGVGDVVLFRN